jgi:antitoxin (DNA-binding transcriptional repressor) of toxin-antitoxin stability system
MKTAGAGYQDPGIVDEYRKREMAERVGIRQLSDSLIACLRRGRLGESLLIVDCGTHIARLTPAAPELRVLADRTAEALVEYGGGKPSGVDYPPKVRGGPISDLTVERWR